MQLRTLGKTGLEVSPLCVGTWQLAGPVNFDGHPDGHPDPGKQTTIRLIQELGGRGLNFIDTAEQYGAGEAERRTGEALEGKREDWIISTKFGYRVGPGVTRIDDSSPATILPSLEGSLERLRTDHIDIFLYHCAPDVSDLTEAREILENARQTGKIGHFGISTDCPTMARALHAEGLLQVLQFPSNLLEPAHELTRFCEQHDVGTQVRGVLAQGRLSGKYFDSQPRWNSDDNRSVHLANSDLSKYSSLARLLPENYTMAQAAIRWVLDQPAHDSICLGAKNLADYDAAIDALTLPALDPQVRTSLETEAEALA